VIQGEVDLHAEEVMSSRRLGIGIAGQAEVHHAEVVEQAEDHHAGVDDVPVLEHHLRRDCWVVDGRP
jgi:hypothetical protein